MNPDACVDIGGGCLLPLVGLGTWNVTAGDVAPAARAALECGCRHVGTAYGYGGAGLPGAAHGPGRVTGSP